MRAARCNPLTATRSCPDTQGLHALAERNIREIIADPDAAMYDVFQTLRQTQYKRRTQGRDRSGGGDAGTGRRRGRSRRRAVDDDGSDTEEDIEVEDADD